MKKVFSIFLVVLVVGLSAVSCKSHERCPAYSKANTSCKKSV